MEILKYLLYTIEYDTRGVMDIVIDMPTAGFQQFIITLPQPELFDQIRGHLFTEELEIAVGHSR